MPYKSELTLFNSSGQRKYLNSEERNNFYVCSKKYPQNIKLFAATLFWTGARISEVLNLKYLNFNQVEQNVVIETLKRRRKGVFRQVPLPSDLLTELLMFSSSKIESNKVWQFSRRTANRYIYSIMKDAKIIGPQACPKGIRHSFAVECIVKGIPINLIQRWLGHSSITTTTIYLDVIGEEEKIFARKLWY